jgi:hypothetical protein
MQPLIKPMTLIKETWQTFLKTWDTTVRLSAWYILIAIGAAIAAFLRNGQLGSEFISAIIQITVALGSVYFAVKLYQLAFSIEDAKPVSKTTESQTWKMIANLLIAGFLIAVPIMICVGIIFLIVGISIFSRGMRPEAFAILIPLILAFIAAIFYISIRLGFVQGRIVDRNASAIEAIKYSWALSKNRFWALTGRVLLSGLIFGALTGALMLIGIILVTMVSGVNIGAEVSQQKPSSSIESIVSLIQGIVMAGIIPLFYIFKTKLYRNVEKSGT